VSTAHYSGCKWWVRTEWAFVSVQVYIYRTQLKIDGCDRFRVHIHIRLIPSILSQIRNLTNIKACLCRIQFHSNAFFVSFHKAKSVRHSLHFYSSKMPILSSIHQTLGRGQSPSLNIYTMTFYTMTAAISADPVFTIYVFISIPFPCQEWKPCTDDLSVEKRRQHRKLFRQTFYFEISTQIRVIHVNMLQQVIQTTANG